MFIERINDENCTRCGFCRKVCPALVFEQGKENRVIIARPGACRGCDVCRNLCKVKAIVCRPPAELPRLA